MNTTRGRSTRARAHAGGAALPDETRALIIALAGQELSVRAIAARAGCSTGSVSNVCRLAGIPLDRGKTKAATEARQAGMRADRAGLAAELLALARDELARLRRPHAEYWGVGGREPVVLSQMMPEPPPRARRELINGAMALVDRHLRLAEAESDGDFSAVDQWLASVMPDSP